MSRRGENIYKRKDGRWEGRYVKERVLGKVKYGYVYARTYKELRQKLAVVLETSKKEDPVPHSDKETADITGFQTIALAWLEDMKPQLKYSSIVKYTNVLTAYLFPRFENRSIASITGEEVHAFSRELLQSGGVDGKGLSPGTVTCILSVLKSIFRYADRSGTVPVIDISRYSVRQPQKTMRILSLPEQQRLSEYLYEHLSLTNLGILVSLYTGIRIGELCALKWEDISFDEHLLYVHRTMQRIQNKENAPKKTSVLVTAPKSESSIRKIPIPDNLFAIIKEAKCQQNAYFLTGKEQTYMEPRALQYRFKRIIRVCNIEDANFHALRHTFATRCVELGFDVKSLSEILGHASVTITLNRYVHPSMQLKQKNMNMLSDLFAVK